MEVQIPQFFSPSHIVFLSLFCTLSLGTLLLSLPIAQHEPIAFVDVLFTTITAITGTGLMTVPMSCYTSFGLTTITALMQIGAIGFVILILTLIYIFFEINSQTEVLIADVLEVEVRRNIKKIIFFVIAFTLALELLGALCLLPSFYTAYGWPTGLWHAIFYAISAFANAGLTLSNKSLSDFSQNYVVLTTLGLLMFIGNIGFITLREGLKYIQAFFKGKKYTFSAASKIIWKSITLLFITTAILFWFLEADHAFMHFSTVTTLFNALFNAIGSMGTGLRSVPMYSLRPATYILIMVAAYIGASPGSAGSGIKTTTIAIFLAAVRAVIFGNKYATIGGKKIAREQMRIAIAIITFSISWITFTTFCLAYLQEGHRFIDVVFESISAFTTLGFTTGITLHLTTISKFLIMITMILGQVGPLTFIIATRKTLGEETT